MALPKLGYLCLSENPSGEEGRALVRQFVLVREADRMGYDDIWLGEHHFDRAWPTGAITALLGHLAAVTSKARIGAMVLTPALRDAVQLAEDVATIDLLSKGRFEFGAASGVAFANTLSACGLGPAEARQRLRSSLALVQDLLSGQPLPGGDAARPVTLVPMPAQRPLRVWIASDDEASLRHAASQGWGLMAAATHSRARVRRAVQLYTEASGGRAPALVLARFACTAATRDEALTIARPYFETFAAKARAAGWGTSRERSIAGDVQALVEESLVGSHAEVAAQFHALGTAYGASRVAIVPTSAQFDTHKHILADFVDEVRPLFDE
ncbi:LLM class flavin-dependent oxidoreductase [Methylibium sp.]|uniref:LLM class flavin-dependent oxidoreductase n=1 Tax=Methylibium sp. TaxID=2067992 RepID=UPI003D1323C7